MNTTSGATIAYGKAPSLPPPRPRRGGTVRAVALTGRPVGNGHALSEATCEAMFLIALATVSWPAAALCRFV